MQLIQFILLALGVGISISLLRAYSRLPIKELKKRALAGDQTAVVLHRAVSYGASLTVLLWVFIGLFSAGLFVVLAETAGGLLSIILIASLIWAGFAWLSSNDVKKISLWFASTLAPAFAWALEYLHGFLSKIIGFIGSIKPVTIHTGLYDKEDLLQLINNQNGQIDNRVKEDDLALAFHALVFGEKTVGEYMTPKRVVVSVNLNDDIGPVLMDELHSSGLSRFPVYETKKDNIIGTLYLRDLVGAAAKTKVSNVMKKEVYFIHEDQTLHEALGVILKTKHHLLIVVNGFEEFSGVITLEDILEQLIGHKIVDEFDQYDDMRAVANKLAKSEHANHND